ncbi:Molybdate-binding periplasmic protein precursor [Kluyvera cryocrescens]|uniref:Molybdate-binding periplasmic protein n=1 Tax=Kluyvera cryocrescens TaxID=580 RepID=A0A485CMK9_KLUCR|nr:Molybdate-binding periplasmic protein precursor [Kluyvera cryocrescens]
MALWRWLNVTKRRWALFTVLTLLPAKVFKVVGTFPEDSHKKVEYPIAITDGHKNATVSAFYDYLKGPQASEIFKRYGFTTR